MIAEIGGVGDAAGENAFFAGSSVIALGRTASFAGPRRILPPGTRRVTGSMPQFGLLLMLALLPLQVLSGALTPRESMPEIGQNMMLAAPNMHFVILAQAILFRGAGISVVWPQLAALFMIGAIFFYFSLRRFRRFLR